MNQKEYTAFILSQRSCTSYIENRQIIIMNYEDKEIMDEFFKVRNLNKRTIYGYKNAIKLYTNFNKMSLSELLEEAEIDEENGVRWKNRKQNTIL